MAGTVIRRTRVRGIVASADAAAVEVPRTVCRCKTPFAYDEPKIRSAVAVCVRACELSSSARTGKQWIGVQQGAHPSCVRFHHRKRLGSCRSSAFTKPQDRGHALVRVQGYALEVGLRHKVVPRADRLERVVDDDQQARLVGISPGVANRSVPRMLSILTERRHSHRLRCQLQTTSASKLLTPKLPSSSQQIRARKASGLVQEREGSDDLPVLWLRSSALAASTATHVRVLS